MTNPDSILDSVKKVIGFDSDYTAFDLDLTLFINAAFGSLQMMGVGGDTGFMISDNTTLWSQYVANLLYLGMIKQYVCMVVRLAFDPPPTSFGLEAIRNQISELAWRINIVAEQINPPSDPFGIDDDEGDVKKTYFVVKTVSLSYAPVVTPDASIGNTFYLSLTGACTLNAPVGGADGEHITMELTSNGNSVTWGAGWNFGSAGTPVLSADGKSDIISAVWRATANEWYAGYSPGF